MELSLHHFNRLAIHLWFAGQLFRYKPKIQKLNETQSIFELDYFDYVNVGGYEQSERIANSLAQ